MIEWSKKGEGLEPLKDGKDQQPRGISHPSEDPSFGTPKCKSNIETCDDITNSPSRIVIGIQKVQRMIEVPLV